MSVTDVVVPMVNEITKPLVQHALQELDYLIRPKKYVKKMNLELEPLVPARDALQQAVDEAKNFGKEIVPEVLQWLSSVNKIIDDAENFKCGGKTCFGGRCINLGSQYQVNKGANEISERVSKLSAPPSSTSVALPPPPPTVESDPNVIELESTKLIMGRIVEALEDESCDIVGLVGMGGVGKTTIVKKLGEKLKGNGQFVQVVLAVVSQTVDVKGIQDQLASMLKLELRQDANESIRASQLKTTILNINSILVILDDVWKKPDLDAIGIPHGNQRKGCKILLTTREEQVCTGMGVRPAKRIRLQVLSGKESWELFRRTAGEEIDSPRLKKEAEEVMGECGGLPIALVTVGSALREKDIKSWTSAKLQLKNSKDTSDMTDTVFPCIRLSYDHIKGEDAKFLFLLCSSFPEDYNIRIEELVRYAIGKDSLFGHDVRVRTIEEARTYVYAIVGKLKASHLLLESENKKDHIKMHDVVRDVAISIASGGEHGGFLVRTGQELTEWPRRDSMESFAGVSLMGNDIEVLDECPPDAAKLEILSLRGNKVHKIGDTFFEGMKRLRVLDISREYPGKIRLEISSLRFPTHLRTLLLDACKLDEVSVIGKLKELEVLSLRGCNFSIYALPVEIGELSRLRLLDLSHCSVDIMPANVISRLSRLEELYMMESFWGWKADQSSSLEEGRGNASLSEVQSLPRLAKVSIDVQGIENFPADFALPQTVTCLTIRVGSVWEFRRGSYYPEERYLGVSKIHDLDGLKRTLHLANALRLDHLELYGRSEDYGIIAKHNCHKLATNIAVEDEVILTDLFDKVGNGFDDLTSLSIKGIKCITSLATSPATSKIIFPNLQRLVLDVLPNMRNLGIEGPGVLPHGSLQNLRLLHIIDCPTLQGAAVPCSRIQMLNNLEELKIQSCKEVTEVFGRLHSSEEDSTGDPPSLTDLPRPSPIRSTVVAATGLLKRIEINTCTKLGSIFPPGFSQSLSHLESLIIFNCSGIEVIFEEDELAEDGVIIPSPPICLPNLKFVKVSGHCCKLKSLFTVSIAQGCPQLEHLELQCYDFQEIVSYNGHGGVEDNNRTQILWPRLSTMKLVKMRNLRRICPINCFVDVPHLKTLNYYECPKMENFASDTTAYGLTLPQSVKPELLSEEQARKVI